jgi:tellurite resistance protein
MPREQLAETRRARNEALVDVMLLAAAADGVMQNSEIRSVIARVLERPEFTGTGPDELASLVERSVQRLSSASALEEVLASLRTRLPDHRTRMLAFGLATAVALADKGARRDELGLLKTLQAALGVSETEVADIFECVQQGHPLAEVVGEPVERLLAETMVLVSTCDGAVHEKEVRVMLESMAGDPVFRGLSLELAERALEDAVANLSLHGLAKRLTVLAHGLSTRGQRLKAFELAARVAKSNRPPRPEEQRMLDLLQATFGLADDEVDRIKKVS